MLQAFVTRHVKFQVNVKKNFHQNLVPYQSFGQYTPKADVGNLSSVDHASGILPASV